MHLFLFGIFFIKSYSLCNSSLLFMDIQKQRCRVFLEVITSTDRTSVSSLYPFFIYFHIFLYIYIYIYILVTKINSSMDDGN